VRRWLAEPLLHFLAAGALIFAVYSMVSDGRPDDPGIIVVGQGQVDTLVAVFERTWRRNPTPDEVKGLIDGYVREEVFYREGLALGLDRDDQVVRRRIGQKMEFVMEELTPGEPTTAELLAWLDAHPADYQIEARYSFRQIYFDPGRHKERLQADVAAARRALEAGESFSGDQTMLPADLDATPAIDVSRIFGIEFENALRTLPIGRWQGPVRSGFGLHLVELRRREGERRATLEEVRPAVERDVLRARNREAAEAFYRKLLAGYEVRVESKNIAAASDK
jgi:hypothetical protein